MKRILLILILISCFCGNNLFAQTPTLQQKLYYTCKVWGFVKYYHSEVSTCHVNWDSVLLRTIPLVRSAATIADFNDALDTMLAAAGPMALSATYFPDTLPAELKRNRDWSWISSSVLRSDVQIQLDTIKNNFRPHPSCYVIRNLTPKTLYSIWGGYLAFPTDTVLLNINTTTSYPDQDHRQLQFFKMWNTFAYFNPNNYMLDRPWDSTLFNYVLPIDAAANAQSLYYLYLNISTDMCDAHTQGLIWGSYQTPPGWYQPYLRLKYFGGQYVVVKSSVTGIYPGDAIISIDGKTTMHWEDSLKYYYSSGNLSVLRRAIYGNILARPTAGVNESLVVEDSTGTNHTFIVPTTIIPYYDPPFFSDYYYPADSLSTIKWTTMACDIGYVNIGNIQNTDVSAVYASLRSKSAIIFDIRNYPKDNAAWTFADLMYANRMEFAKFTEPVVTYPGTFSWFHDYLGSTGNPTPYTGKVIILMNEQTQSAAEFSCMALEAMPNAVKVGSQTAGADGNVTWFGLSQDIRYGYSSLGVYYPNGDSTQRIGIVPDSVVYPTRAGIRHHDDDVLNKALEIAGCINYANNVKLPVPDIMVYPNPAQNELTITSTDKISNVVITNLVGETIYDHKHDAKRVQVDVANLSAGVYFIKIDGTEVRKFVKQ